MRTIQPFDLSLYSPEILLKTSKIIETGDNFAWRSTLFPSSMQSNLEHFISLPYDRENIITLIDDAFYIQYNLTILQKKEQTINTLKGKKVIKCKEYGDYNNSIKRYNLLNQSISYNKDNNANLFLNISKPLDISTNVIRSNLQFNPNNIFIPNKKISLEDKIFGVKNTHPFIAQPKSTGVIKHNNKPIINKVFEWIKEQGINYVYSINELRPYVISDNYVTNLVYYTVTGSK